MKKLFALLLCLALTLSLVPAAFAEGVPEIADTYFAYGYNASADLWMDYFFHFYGEVPGLGQVFYAGYALNQITYTGTYEIVAEEREYQCWPDRAAVEAAGEGAEAPAGTAPYTIIFYDFDGNELDRCAMDEDHIYNDMQNLTGIGGDHAVYNLDADPENSEFAKEYEGEVAVVMLSLVNPEDDTATLDLKINGKYDDLVVLYVEGTYSMNEDQSVITLTPDDDSDPGATVTLNEDGTYAYVSTDGDEVTLAAVKAAEVAYALKGEIPVPGMDGTMADFVCDLYNDGNAVLYADFMGNRMDVDQGTYDIDMETYSFNIHFENAGDITTEGYAADMVLNYKVDDVQPFGAIEQTLNFVTE